MNENTETKLGGGMYETVKEHSEKIGELAAGLGDHAERLVNVETITLSLKESDRQHGEKLMYLSSQYTQIQNTIMAANKETQDVLKDHNSKMYEVVQSSVSFKENSEERAAKAEKRKHDYKVLKWKTAVDAATKLILSLSASGGFLYWLFER